MKSTKSHQTNINNILLQSPKTVRQPSHNAAADALLFSPVLRLSYDHTLHFFCISLVVLLTKYIISKTHTHIYIYIFDLNTTVIMYNILYQIKNTGYYYELKYVLRYPVSAKTRKTI